MLGENSENIEKLNRALNVKINFFGNKLTISGTKKNVDLTQSLISKVFFKFLVIYCFWVITAFCFRC